jgi:hypothetical protein
MPHNPTKLDLADVLGYTEEIGIDVDGFPQRVASNKYKGVVQQDVRGATQARCAAQRPLLSARVSPTALKSN